MTDQGLFIVTYISDDSDVSPVALDARRFYDAMTRARAVTASILGTHPELFSCRFVFQAWFTPTDDDIDDIYDEVMEGVWRPVHLNMPSDETYESFPASDLHIVVEATGGFFLRGYVGGFPAASLWLSNDETLALLDRAAQALVAEEGIDLS